MKQDQIERVEVATKRITDQFRERFARVRLPKSVADVILAASIAKAQDTVKSDLFFHNLKDLAEIMLEANAAIEKEKAFVTGTDDKPNVN